MPGFGSTRDLEGNVFDLDNVVNEAVDNVRTYVIGMHPDVQQFGIVPHIPNAEHKIWAKQQLGSTGVGNEVVSNTYIYAPAPNWTMGPIQIYAIRSWTVDEVGESVSLQIGNTSNIERYLASFDIANLGQGENGEYVYTRPPVNTSLGNSPTVTIRVTSKKGRTGTDIGGQALIVVTFYRP